MERDAFGLPIKKNASAKKKSTNPFADDIESDPEATPTSSNSAVITAVLSDEDKCDDDIEMKELEDDNGAYNPSAERQLSRNSFKSKLLRAERKLLKQGFGQSIVAIDPEDENAVVRFLLSQRGETLTPTLPVEAYNLHHTLLITVYGYPGTKGTIMSNYIQFVLNRHPLLGLFCHHRQHPFKTKLRVVVFLLSLSFAFCLSVFMLDKMYFKEVSAVLRRLVPSDTYHTQVPFLFFSCCLSICIYLAENRNLCVPMDVMRLV